MAEWRAEVKALRARCDDLESQSALLQASQARTIERLRAALELVKDWPSLSALTDDGMTQIQQALGACQTPEGAIEQAYALVIEDECDADD